MGRGIYTFNLVENTKEGEKIMLNKLCFFVILIIMRILGFIGLTFFAISAVFGWVCIYLAEICLALEDANEK